MAQEKKYEGRDDDGNINFTREHELDDTDDINWINTNDSVERLVLQNQDDINRTNANDRDESSILQNHDAINRTNASNREERSILQNQDGGQYQGQHTAISWVYNNRNCTMLLRGSVAYNFPSFSGIHQVFVPTNTY